MKTNAMKRTTLCGLGVALLFAAPALADGTTQYTDRTTFENALDTIILDDYEAEGYRHGDIIDTQDTDTHSNAHMSGILGETDYFTTGWDNMNKVIFRVPDRHYCAGCNGSFELSFTTTSVGSASGVYGVGLDIEAISFSDPYHVFVTFGDDSTLDVALHWEPGSYFWGITSKLDIKSIHIGLVNGGSTTEGYFEMDNLTIGNVPAPGVLVMLGIAGLAHRRRRR